MFRGLCGSRFWDLDKTWNTIENPDFTYCFEETALVWVPCIFLLVFGTPYTFLLWKTNSNAKRERFSKLPLPWTVFFIAKITLSSVLLALSIADLIHSVENYINDSSFVDPIDFQTPLLKSLTFAYVIFLTFLHRRCRVHTSAIMFIFWLLLAIGSAFNYRTILILTFDTGHYEDKVDCFTFATKMLYFPVVVAQLFISCFAETSLRYFLSAHKKKLCPEESASFLSKITFSWMSDMILSGYKRPITISDMWRLNKVNYSNKILENFNKIWKPAAKAKTKHESDSFGISRDSILRVVIKNFWPSFLLMSLIKIIASLLTFVNPLVLDELMNFLDPNSNEPNWRGYLYASLMFISPMLESILNNQHEFGINRISMRVRTCLISAIYQKSLKVSSNGRKDFTAGEIVNLMSVDIQRIMDYLLQFNTLMSAPIQISIACYLLWQQLGVSSIAGIFSLVLLLPFNGWITDKIRKQQIALMLEKDRRVKLMNEILNGIKVLKLYAWESSFQKQVMAVREKEVNILKRIAYLNGALIFAFSCAPFFVGLASFATYVLIDTRNVLNANKAFVSLSLFNIIKLPMVLLPLLLSSHAMFLVSISRINNFLKCDEIRDSAVTHNISAHTPIRIKNATFKWNKRSEFTLKNISLEVPKNKLIAVVGRVGSGKSSLISAILGEMEKLDGHLNTFGSIAYVPQEAWIQNATVRQNITFVSDYNEIYYQQVVDACALDADIKMLADSDATEIGEKGINLSGGQKQRISLARAVYSNADIYLFDDPLSAVDAHVGRHLFDKVIGPNGILSNKTRLLVTHRISVLPYVDEVIVLTNGSISERGKFDELIANKGDFAEFIEEYLLEQAGGAHTDEEELQILRKISNNSKQLLNILQLSTEKSTDSNNFGSSGVKLLSITDFGSTDKLSKKDGSDCGQTSYTQKAKQKKKLNGRLIEAERTETGSIKLSVYKTYAKSFGVLLVSLVISLLLLSNGAQIFYGLWLSDWSNDALDPKKVNDIGLRYIRLSVYGVFGLLESVFNVVASILLNIVCIKASKLLHNNMLSRIMIAPMSFFDTTPIGRILNRISRDVDIVDTTLFMNMRTVLMQSMRILVAFAMISIQTVIILFVILPLGFLYYYIYRIFIATSRQLKRIDSITRSPIYEHFSETINGTTSIRAYNVGEQFMKESNRRVDDNHVCYYPSFTASRWLAVRLEFIGYSIVFVAALFTVLYRDTITPGIAGLSIVYSLNITFLLSYFVKAASDFESNSVSIERCFEYSHLPSEVVKQEFESPLADNWPDKGTIKFKKYSTRYREGLECVLKNISLEINSCEKVGIVGRTGAGKSSLILALFRLIEPTDGTIVIDKVDIRTLSLYQLRSRLTVIPQDPILFTGTLRMNLDPFNTHSDNEIWRALELAHLKDFVVLLDKGLGYYILEGGENLSVGQKQLICLARALLRKTKILVLDEATSAVDMETDDIIQETIRNEFNDCTVVTIAHRLNTILDYNRVLVMDNGRVAEYDTPNALLANNNSIFYSLAKEANIV